VVRGYNPVTDHASVIRIFKEGLLGLKFPDIPSRERIVRGYVEYVEGCLKQDMGDIEEYYCGEGKRFMVAEKDGHVCGTVALDRYEGRSDGGDKHDVPPGMKVAELRRMSVDAPCRRMGVGKALLDAFEAECRELGYAEIVLTTSEFQPGAMRLYEASGFIRYKVASYPIDHNTALGIHFYRKSLLSTHL